MDNKKLDEIAIKHASSLRDANSFDNEFTMRHHIRAALDEAVAERDKEWRTALFPNTPTVEFTPEMAAKTVRAFVADERKALRGAAVLLRDDESDPDFDRICNDRVAGWKAGLCEFLAALDARETVRNATPSAENGQADNPDALRSQILCLEARLEERRKLFASLLAALDAREKESR